MSKHATNLYGASVMPRRYMRASGGLLNVFGRPAKPGQRIRTFVDQSGNENDLIVPLRQFFSMPKMMDISPNESPIAAIYDVELSDADMAAVNHGMMAETAASPKKP